MGFFWRVKPIEERSVRLDFLLDLLASAHHFPTPGHGLERRSGKRSLASPSPSSGPAGKVETFSLAICVLTNFRIVSRRALKIFKTKGEPRDGGGASHSRNTTLVHWCEQ